MMETPKFDPKDFDKANTDLRVTIGASDILGFFINISNSDIVIPAQMIVNMRGAIRILQDKDVKKTYTLDELSNFPESFCNIIFSENLEFYGGNKLIKNLQGSIMGVIIQEHAANFGLLTQNLKIQEMAKLIQEYTKILNWDISLDT